MKVLVAYASRHGSTAGIAERIADGLRGAGAEVDVAPVAEVADLGGYDAAVVGGAAYMFHWLRDASSFVRRHRVELTEVPTWLFSSGPLGTDDLDKEGRDVFESTRPKEFDELADAVASRGERVFRGAWTGDGPPVGIGERMMRLMPAARDALPVGDFREWDQVDAWAAEIAGGLGLSAATAG